MVALSAQNAGYDLTSENQNLPTLRFDLHVHTHYSYDCLLSLKRLAAVVHRKGLNGIAVLDHDEIEGALRLRDRAPFQVIVGEEIGTLLYTRIDGGFNSALDPSPRGTRTLWSRP